MAAAAAATGDERVRAAAQQIVRSLGTSANATEDMIMILSSFDNRLSTITGLFSSTSLAAADGAAEADPRSAGERRLDAAEKIILKWDSPAAGSLPWEDSPDEARDYLAAVDEILYLTEEDGDDAEWDGELLDRAETLLQIAMSRLEEEFRQIMLRNTVPLDADQVYGSIRRASSSFMSDGGDSPSGEGCESPMDNEREKDQEGSSRGRTFGRERNQGWTLSEDFNVDLVRPQAIEDLKDIADRMIRSRYEKECCQVYSSVRRDVLDECISVLGVEKISIDDVQRIEWNVLDEKMKKWVQSVKVVITVLLSGEKQLCDHIFGDSEVVKEVCFTESAKGCVIQLLHFGEAVAIGQRSSEKLFRLLDMYDALATVMSDLQSLFPQDSRDYICEEAEAILRGLGDAARGTFTEFENAIQRESSRKTMQGGDIHPLTRYVMNYLRLLVDYEMLLNTLLDWSGEQGEDLTRCDSKDSSGGDGNDNKYSGSMTPFGNHLRSLIGYLESNIEEKSKLYDEGGLQFVFLMNNILYIVQKVKDTDLGRQLGDQWIRKRRGQIRQYATSYLRAAWTKVLSFLKDDGLGSGGGSSSNVSKVALKERFKNFNLAYEEIYRTQSTWKVPDSQLREELRISISEKVIPAYRSFMGRFGCHLEGARHAAKYIKYTAEDLEAHLPDLFEGAPATFGHLRRKLSS